MEFLRNISFLLFFFLLFFQPVFDFDLWYHLSVGRYIFTFSQIPKVDLFSFTFPDFPSVYHSWGTEYFLYLIYSQKGLLGISIFYALIFTAGIKLLEQSFNNKLKSGYYYLCLALSTPFYSYIVYQRTQVVSFFFICLLYFLFRKIITYPQFTFRLLLILPFISFIWANLHGGFSFGLILISLFSIINIVYQSLHSQKISQDILIIILIPFLSLLSTFLNPFYFALHIHAITMGTNPSLHRLNLDYLPLFASSGFVSQFFAVILTLLTLTLLIAGKKTDFRFKTMILLLFLASLYSRRYVLPLSVFLFPELIRSFLLQIKNWIRNLISSGYEISFPLITALIALIIVIFSKIPLNIFNLVSSYSNESVYASKNNLIQFPFAAINYLKKNGIPTRLLNEFNWGGYLEWNFPNNKFFMDNNTETLYLNNQIFILKYWEITQAHPGWENYFEKYDINGVLAPSARPWPLIKKLLERDDWQIVYQDDISILLQKASLNTSD